MLVSKLSIYKSNICSIIVFERSNVMYDLIEVMELYLNASEEDQEFVLQLLNNQQPSSDPQPKHSEINQ